MTYGLAEPPGPIRPPIKSSPVDRFPENRNLVGYPDIQHQDTLGRIPSDESALFWQMLAIRCHQCHACRYHEEAQSEGVRA